MARSFTLETLLLLVLSGFAGLFLLATKDYGSTAALFPRVIASATLVLIALDLLYDYLLAATKTPKTRADKAPDQARSGWMAPLALQGGYIALIYVAGFAAATLIYLLICPWQLRYRRWVVTIVHAVVFTAVLVYTFHSVFHARLPKGVVGLPF
ncbi:MAG TPA: tripartite tricarboxylate transporter TctB family protein [Candidatus Binatia bacterium]|nr:tripartite tricarboxylate transporter TctB family protein [Candidatus Binatia bacterium]